jgi:hypothetical protein
MLPKVAGKAKAVGLTAVVLDDLNVPFGRALIVGDGITIPWSLVPHGMHFLEAWDMAAPLWRYGVLAKDTGTREEQKRTETMTKDLRQLLYAHELLFIRSSEAGRAFLEAWKAEMGEGGDKRLAFLRALHLVKPLFLALPRTWIAEVAQAAELRRILSNADEHRAAARRTAHQPPGNLVRVEVAPGRFVKCYAGNEEKVKREYELAHMTREGRRKALANTR